MREEVNVKAEISATSLCIVLCFRSIFQTEQEENKQGTRVIKATPVIHQHWRHLKFDRPPSDKILLSLVPSCRADACFQFSLIYSERNRTPLTSDQHFVLHYTAWCGLGKFEHQETDRFSSFLVQSDSSRESETQHQIHERCFFLYRFPVDTSKRVNINYYWHIGFAVWEGHSESSDTRHWSSVSPTSSGS